MLQLSRIASGLTDVASLPSKALKLVIENYITRQIASYLGQFLAILGLAIDANILLILAFIIVAVIAFWVINWIINLFNPVDPCDPCSIVDCNDQCCDDESDFCCDSCLLG